MESIVPKDIAELALRVRLSSYMKTTLFDGYYHDDKADVSKLTSHIKAISRDCLKWFGATMPSIENLDLSRQRTEEDLAVLAWMDGQA